VPHPIPHKTHWVPHPSRSLRRVGFEALSSSHDQRASLRASLRRKEKLLSHVIPDGRQKARIRVSFVPEFWREWAKRGLRKYGRAIRQPSASHWARPIFPDRRGSLLRRQPPGVPDAA
jgi:hypothetical protein